MFNISKKNKREFNFFSGLKRGVLGLIVSAFVFNMFFAGLLNITSYVKNLKNKNFIVAELQPDLSQEKKFELEEKLLNLKEVQKVIYVDRYMAFQELQKDLGIVIPRGENPLSDSFRIYFKNAEDVGTLQNVLEETQDVKEFFVDGIYISEIGSRIRVLNIFGIISVIGIVCSLFLIQSIFLYQMENDYLINVITDEYNPRNRIKAKNINLLPFTISILIGMILFFNVYVIIRKALIEGGIFAEVLSLLQIFYIQGGVALLIILFAWFVPVERKKMGESR